MRGAPPPGQQHRLHGVDAVRRDQFFGIVRLQVGGGETQIAAQLIAFYNFPEKKKG